LAFAFGAGSQPQGPSGDGQQPAGLAPPLVFSRPVSINTPNSRDRSLWAGRVPETNRAVFSVGPIIPRSRFGPPRELQASSGWFEGQNSSSPAHRTRRGKGHALEEAVDGHWMRNGESRGGGTKAALCCTAMNAHLLVVCAPRKALPVLFPRNFVHPAQKCQVPGLGTTRSLRSPGWEPDARRDELMRISAF
jgi:hypothetical protein